MPTDFVTANTILYCSNWEASIRFYRDGLGLPTAMANEWFVEFVVTDTARLSLADEQRATIKCSGGAGLTLTLQVDDLEAAWARAVDAGIGPTDVQDHPWGAKVFYLYDPDGRRIEVWQSLGAP